jgi:chemotaxis protein MotB
VSAGDEEAKVNELVIIRRRSNGEEGGHKGGVWKIAYADFMTAMMAFFLVMWLINATDKQTLTQVATYFNPMRLTDKTPAARGLHQSETGSPAREPAAGNPKPQPGQSKADSKGDSKAEGSKPMYTEEALFRDPYSVLSKLAGQADADQRRAEATAQRSGEAYRDPFEPAFRRETQADKSRGDKSKAGKSEIAKTAPPAAPAAEPATPTAPVAVASPAAQPAPSQPAKDKDADTRKGTGESPHPPPAAQLEAQIKQAVARSLTGALPGIDVKVTEEGVLISLTDDYDFGMFAIASAEPRPAMVVVMDKLAKVLAAQPERLVVRGHTDGRPYKSGTYDNWRLSSARAHMAYYMLVRGGIDEKRFERVEGHADRSLRVADDPEAAQNRRIEILLRKAKP